MKKNTQQPWKRKLTGPFDKRGKFHSKIKDMMTFITRFVWFCNVLPKFFMVIHLRGQGLSLRKKTLLHCKDYIVAVAKRIDSNKVLEILFCIISIN